MADIKAKFGSPQTLTISLASLANNSARQSDEVDNSTDRNLDALVSIKVKTGSSGVSTGGGVSLFAFATADGGTTRTENAGSGDAGITLTTPPNARLVGFINANGNGATFYGGPFSVAAAFGGVLPEKWGLILLNETGAALDSTSGNHAVKYQGVKSEVV